MKKLTILLLITAVAAFGFDVGGLGGGGEIDTTKADALLAKMDEVAGSFESIQTTLDAATTVLNDIATVHGIADALADPVATAKIASELSDDEKAQLQAQVEALTKLPDDIAKITAEIPGIVSGTPDVITDLTNQITDNPLKAGELNSLKDKLDAGTESCGTITEEAGTTVEKATTLSDTISAIL
ncbi:MAG: hypothetical protein GY771_16225 [bacterium]|nr:hypothetical protein [bacterium]